MKTQTLPKKPYVIYDDYEMLFLDEYGCFVDLECARVFHYTEEEVKHERRFEPSCRFFLEVDEVNEDDEPVKLKPHNVAGVDGYTAQEAILTPTPKPATKAPMTTNEFLQKLEKMGACQEARDWVATQPDAQTAWDSCTNFGWLLWYFNGTATAEVLEECENVQQPAWREYEKACLATVRKLMPSP